MPLKVEICRHMQNRAYFFVFITYTILTKYWNTHVIVKFSLGTTKNLIMTCTISKSDCREVKFGTCSLKIQVQVSRLVKLHA